MMENRSFDHFLGWLPGANGTQAGLSFVDTKGARYPTYNLAPDYEGCGYADPNHDWNGGLIQLNGGKMDGFLKTANPGDTFPIGYYTQGHRQRAGLAGAGLWNVGQLLLRDPGGSVPEPLLPAQRANRSRHHNINRAQQPAVLHTARDLGPVDPAAARRSRDDHPHADVRAGEFFIWTVYNAVRNSPAWNRTVLVFNYDEWGGFFDHVVPPHVIDTKPLASNPLLDTTQLGVRVPLAVVSPLVPQGTLIQGGAPFEHTSVLKMIEWRFGLQPLTARDYQCAQPRRVRHPNDAAC